MALERIGAMWLHQDRVTYGRPTCSVELVYARNSPPGFDLAGLQHRARLMLGKGVQVWVRVDLEPGQTLPAPGDDDALHAYLDFLQQLATDSTIRQSRGVICGNEPNLTAECRVSGVPIDPDWAARVVLGYGRPRGDTDNAYQWAKTFQPSWHVLLPAIAPYSPDGGVVSDYPPPDSRGSLSPWEQYQHRLAYCAYEAWRSDNHVPSIGDVQFAVHTYSRVGHDGTANGGVNEPWQDVREPTYGAQFGTRWLEDCLYAIQQTNGGVPPPILISEWNTYLDNWPDENYPKGLLRQVAAYVNFKPNVMGLCNFVDQDYGSGWARTSMTAQPFNQHIANWNADFDMILETGTFALRRAPRRFSPRGPLPQKTQGHTPPMPDVNAQHDSGTDQSD